MIASCDAKLGYMSNFPTYEVGERAILLSVASFTGFMVQ
jgi:hypothetical protein